MTLNTILYHNDQKRKKRIFYNRKGYIINNRQARYLLHKNKILTIEHNALISLTTFKHNSKWEY